MKKPNLLIKKDLVVPINQALDRIEKIRERKASSEDQIILEGLFVLAVSSFENSLSDTLKIYLNSFPYKLDSKIENLTKEDLLEGDPLDKVINSKINSISYKNLKEMLDYFLKTIALPESSIPSNLFENLLEIKATRNLLIHNNLIVNSQYIESSGTKYRSINPGERLKIDQDYLFKSITTLRDILQKIVDQIFIKYQKYTYLHAVKKLWEFMFPTPVMQFENEWVLDEDHDLIHSYNKESSRRNNLSGSEELLFGIWLSHFEGNGINTNCMNFYKLGNGNRKKLAYFLSVIDLVTAR